MSTKLTRREIERELIWMSARLAAIVASLDDDVPILNVLALDSAREQHSLVVEPGPTNRVKEA